MLSLVSADLDSPAVTLPDGARDHLTLGTRRTDGSVQVIATLDIRGRVMNPERKSTVLRLLQLIGEGVAETDRENLVVLNTSDLPGVNDPA